MVCGSLSAFVTGTMFFAIGQVWPKKEGAPLISEKRIIYRVAKPKLKDLGITY